NSNSWVLGSRIDTPVTSEGSRSGVNWIRELVVCTAAARARASWVFPVPGTSSRSTCPPLSLVVTTSRTTFALPTTATPTAETIFSKVSANQAACSGVIVVCCSVMVMRLLRVRWGVWQVLPREGVGEVEPVAPHPDGHPFAREPAPRVRLPAAGAGELDVGVGAPRVGGLCRGVEGDRVPA